MIKESYTEFFTRKGQDYRFVNTYVFNKILDKWHKIGKVVYSTSDKTVDSEEGYIVFYTDLQMMQIGNLVYISRHYGTKGWVYLVDGVFYTKPQEVYNAIQDHTHFFTFVPYREEDKSQVLTWRCVLCQ